MSNLPPTYQATPKVRIEIWIYLFLTVTTLALYLQVGQFKFIMLDTPIYVFNNLMVRKGITSESIYWALTTFDAGNYHPLTWMSHMLDVELYGLNSGQHHLTNVLFHLANTLILFYLLNKLSAMPLQSGLAACLFGLHPTHIESVAWVAERKDVLCVFFVLLSLYFYFSYVKHGGAKRYFGVFLCYLLALMAKPMAITLPFVLLMLDFWPLTRVHFISPSSNIKRLIPLQLRGNYFKVILEKIPLFVPTIASAIVTFQAQQSAGFVKSFTSIPLIARIDNAVISYVSYIYKTVYPTNLSIIYPYPDTHPIWQLIISFIILAGITILFARIIRKRPYYMIGWLWFLGTLVPVIGIIQVGPQAMADRYTYLSGIGLYIIIAWGLWDTFSSLTSQRKIYNSLSLSLAVIMFMLSWSQLHYWRDSITLFKRSLEVTSNNHYLHLVLGYTYKTEKRYLEAAEEFRAALLSNPRDTYSLQNLCDCLIKIGQTDETINCFYNAIRL
ncbi:MAG: tetratricopeptide repeat protein, partial [Desulfobulbaceae bacterium]|nr:tetratricopeptide repeat protein [Desulfobulbaceae bacterium]